MFQNHVYLTFTIFMPLIDNGNNHYKYFFGVYKNILLFANTTLTSICYTPHYNHREPCSAQQSDVVYHPLLLAQLHLVLCQFDFHIGQEAL